MATFPTWLHVVAIVSLALGGASALLIAVDEARRPPAMAVMRLVWPLTALFGGPLWLWAYLALGRRSAESGDGGRSPMAAAVFKGTCHCGAGCTLGDVVAEWIAFAAPGVATWFGYGRLFSIRMVAVWIPDFLLAYALGVAFQYYAIKPMREVSVAQALRLAVKADTASIAAWQIGMYGAMAVLQFAVLRPAFGAVAPVDSPEFWFAMQIAMLAGFAVAYPVNWWLVRVGVKERM